MTILLIDCYDSFTFNLKSLIEQATEEKCVAIHNDSFKPDEYESRLVPFLNQFSCIFIGPGPGNPTYSEDVGIIPFVFANSAHIPILGICLGFQVLCYQFGADVEYLKDVKHGQVYKIQVNKEDDDFGLFEGCDNFAGVRYHSIHVRNFTDKLIPLAFTVDEDEVDSKVIMAAKHHKFPFYGVQYHPESICSEMGSTLIKNFYRIVKSMRPTTDVELHDPHTILHEPLFDRLNISISTELQFKRLESVLNPIDIVEIFQRYNQDSLLLNSVSSPGTWSIIGLPINYESKVFTHVRTEDQDVLFTHNWKEDKKEKKNIDSFWKELAAFMRERYYPQNTIDGIEVPFVGGMLGVFSYEEGEFINFQTLESIGKDIPTSKLCFIERFILKQNNSDTYFICSIKAGDDNWLNESLDRLRVSHDAMNNVPNSLKDLTNNLTIVKPTQESYGSKFDQCQTYLKQGDSYELCLTDQTFIHLDREITPWQVYKVLTKRNPAPYSAYLKFDDCVLISSSPERFLEWDNEKVELRPIKGTVKLSDSLTYKQGCEILKSSKEKAENLMIVDLIRHDLYNFLSEVAVPELMIIEQYENILQLVSVIRGSFEGSTYSGIDILSQSLPPGSMTGAPKKRSVELLQRLENNQPRGLYSGVCGYWSVNNHSDWSVVIRSTFHYPNDNKNTESTNCWRIGAGGAITVLSTADGEYEEMAVKLERALQAFE
ncbi:hypothetical protein LJB42_004384 [Komagataella kurtzmanii]|nr:hypothetical protein LJB42_004384 [Komagataella kurtzmanii]